MIAYGCSMPESVKLDKKQLQQIHVLGACTLSADGKVVTVFRHDLPMLQNANYSRKVERLA